MSILKHALYQRSRCAGKSQVVLYPVRVTVTSKDGKVDTFEACCEFATLDLPPSEVIEEANEKYRKRSEEDPDFGTVVLSLVGDSEVSLGEAFKEIISHPTVKTYSVPKSAISFDEIKSVKYHNNDWRRKGRGFNGYRSH